MKNKLIPRKYQNGGKSEKTRFQKFLDWFSQVSLNAAVAGSPSVATAVGWRIDENNNAVQDQQTEEGTKQLQDNLAVISTVPHVVIGGPQVVSAIGKALTNPIVDAGLTIHGAITAPKNIKQGIQQIKDGETLKGVGNLALVGLDVTGASNLMKTYSRVRKLLNPVNLNINNFDDSVNDALRFYKTHINPNASLSDYRIYQTNNLPFQYTGEYIPSTKTIRISKKEKPIITRDTIVHEMRHQDDPLIHDQSDFGVFTLDDNRINHYGRLNLTNEQSKMLDNVYSDIKLESERIAVNSGYKASLEKMYIKEYGKIPTVKELNDYIQTLPRGILTLGRYISGYPSITSWISPVLKTKQLKNSLINIK